MLPRNTQLRSASTLRTPSHLIIGLREERARAKKREESMGRLGAGRMGGSSGGRNENSLLTPIPYDFYTGRDYGSWRESQSQHGRGDGDGERERERDRDENGTERCERWERWRKPSMRVVSVLRGGKSCCCWRRRGSLSRD